MAVCDGDNLPVSDLAWQHRCCWPMEQDTERKEDNAGFPVFFMPYFNGTLHRPTGVDAYNGANNTNPSDDIIDGLYNFGGLSSGDNSESGYQKNQSLCPGGHSRHGCPGRLCAPLQQA